MRSGLSGRRRKKNRENEYGVCCYFFEERVRIRERFLRDTEYFSVHGFHEPFFYEKTACVFSAVFLVAPNRRTAVSGRAAFVGRHASERTHRRAGGSSFSRERSNALVPIFAHGVGVSLWRKWRGSYSIHLLVGPPLVSNGGSIDIKIKIILRRLLRLFRRLAVGFSRFFGRRWSNGPARPILLLRRRRSGLSGQARRSRHPRPIPLQELQVRWRGHGSNAFHRPKRHRDRNGVGRVVPDKARKFG